MTMIILTPEAAYVDREVTSRRTTLRGKTAYRKKETKVSRIKDKDGNLVEFSSTGAQSAGHVSCRMRIMRKIAEALPLDRKKEKELSAAIRKMKKPDKFYIDADYVFVKCQEKYHIVKVIIRWDSVTITGRAHDRRTHDILTGTLSESFYHPVKALLKSGLTIEEVYDRISSVVNGISKEFDTFGEVK